MCEFMVDKVEDKNPEDVNGYTPLHAAAAEGELETFKVIEWSFYMKGLDLSLAAPKIRKF